MKKEERKTIALTKKEYLEICKAIDFYELVKDWDNENFESKLLNFWYSFAEKFGLSRPVDIKKLTDKELLEHKPDWTDKVSNEVWDFNHEYRVDVFWKELVMRLSSLIYQRRYKSAGHDDETKWRIMDEIEEKLEDEFEKHGLARISKIEKFV